MDYKRLFTSSKNDLGIEAIIFYLKKLHSEIHQYITDGGCCIQGDQIENYFEELKNTKLSDDPVDTDVVLEEIAALTAGLPIWNHPGTMLNVIPPVNLAATAAGTLMDVLNVNYSQGHYSGNLMLAELKVVKYISDLVGWDWRKSAGLFTFGGKGTSLYALKNAINRAYPEGQENGYDKRFFFLSSIKGHPCHAEVAEWLGIGKKSCIRVGTSDDGKVRIEEAEEIIKKHIEKGEIFIGCILSGGSTVEYEVDNVREVRTLMNHVQKLYGLSYCPWIHVDSVVGWPWLFYNGYDFEANELQVSERVKQKIQSMNSDISGIVEADSFGVDFHKTGFCPYVSSLFMCRMKDELRYVSNRFERRNTDICLEEYSPFEYSLELTRSGKGAISALVALETMGKNGYRQLIADMLDTVDDLRKRLSELPFVELLNLDARGFATLFVMKPPEYADLSLDSLLRLPMEDTEKIKKYNVLFGNYIGELVKQNQTFVNFTSTDAFAVNNTNIYLGMVKVYPMSVLGSHETNEEFIRELCRLKEQFDSSDKDKIKSNSPTDMVYR